MSWGERSCKHLYDAAHRPCRPEIQTCNVNCPFYGWDGKTPPDSKRTATKLVASIRSALAGGEVVTPEISGKTLASESKQNPDGTYSDAEAM